MGNEGWKNLDEVWIPPIEEGGFQEDIVIRKPIAPITLNETKPAEAEAPQNPPLKEPAAVEPEKTAEPYNGEDATVLLADLDDYGGEDATVLLTQEVTFTAWLKRVNTGEKVQIDKAEFVIGKSRDADYVIRDNVTISRKHARIKKTEDGYYLEDMGSSNHTFIDGVMVTEPVKLISGTMFQLSKEIFEFTLV